MTKEEREQLDFQRSVIREEMYEHLGLLELGRRAHTGDPIAKKEWKRRTDEEFPAVKGINHFKTIIK